MVITCMRTVGCKTTLFMRWTVRGPTPSDGSHRGPPRRRCSRAKLVHRSLAQWKPLRIEVATQLSARAQLSPPRARPYRADARAAGPAGPLHGQHGNGSTAPGNNARGFFSGPRFWWVLSLSQSSSLDRNSVVTIEDALNVASFLLFRKPQRLDLDKGPLISFISSKI